MSSHENNEIEEEEVAGHKQISRYVFSKTLCLPSENRLKYSAFIPPSAYPDEVSVFDVHEMNDKQIWDIGAEAVEPLRNKAVYARGDLKVDHVRDIENEHVSKKLNVLHAPVDHPKHANITNIETIEGKRRIIADKLSKLTTLVKR